MLHQLATSAFTTHGWASHCIVGLKTAYGHIIDPLGNLPSLKVAPSPKFAKIRLAKSDSNYIDQLTKIVHGILI